MSYFNTATYNSSDVSYNVEFPIYIDGTVQHIPVNGSLYGGKYFGNVMCAFMVDAGDSILNGNVMITQNVNLAGSLNVITAPSSTTTLNTFTLNYPIPTV